MWGPDNTDIALAWMFYMHQVSNFRNLYDFTEVLKKYSYIKYSKTYLSCEQQKYLLTKLTCLLGTNEN